MNEREHHGARAHDDAVRGFGVVHVDVAIDVNDEAGAAAFSSREEHVAHEEPLEIQVNGVALAVLMRTPGHDVELGRGFLVTERVVDNVGDIESIRHCTTTPDPESEDNVLQVRLRVPFDLDRHRRHTFASSSCGVCGKATIENACRTAGPLALDESVRIAPSVLARLPDVLRAAQLAFAETGGVHGAGLFTLDGTLVALREDVGRHNAVDKVVGAVLAMDARSDVKHGGHFTHGALLVSGRVSFEIVQKAAAARIPIVAGISAPTSLAVRMGRALHVTVIGFLRGASMNVYAGSERVAGA